MTTNNDDKKTDIHGLAKNFDLFNPGVSKCPFDVLSHMRDEKPVHYSEAYGGYWAIVGYDEVNEAARNWRDFTSTHGVVLGDVEERRFVPITYDPPLHTEFRKVTSTFFSKDTAKTYVEPLRDYADTLIDQFIAEGYCDLVEDYGNLLASHVFFKLLFDLPSDEAEYCYKLTNDAMFATDHTIRMEGFAKLGEYALKVICARKGRPPDGGLIDTIRTGVVEGRPMTDEESAGAILTLLLGGHDTMIHAMGNLFVHLGRDTQLRDKVVADMTLLPKIIEESFRHTPTATSIARTVVDDMEFGGEQLKAGDQVLLLWLSANRDEKTFENPEKFDCERSNLKKNIGFGMGPHRCVGEWLARTIMNVAFDRILTRIPDFNVDSEVEIEYRMGQSRGPVGVPVHFTAGAAK